jgi:hypothetical protein
VWRHSGHGVCVCVWRHSGHGVCVTAQWTWCVCDGTVDMVCVCVWRHSGHGVCVCVSDLTDHRVCVCVCRHWRLCVCVWEVSLWFVCVWRHSGHGVCVTAQWTWCVCVCVTAQWTWCVCDGTVDMVCVWRHSGRSPSLLGYHIVCRSLSRTSCRYLPIDTVSYQAYCNLHSCPEVWIRWTEFQWTDCWWYRKWPQSGHAKDGTSCAV